MNQTQGGASLALGYSSPPACAGSGVWTFSDLESLWLSVERPLAAAFPEGFQPRPSEAGVVSASASMIKAVSMAFFFIPAGVYAGLLFLRIFSAFQSVV